MNVFILDDDENIVLALYKMIERSGLPLEKTIDSCSPADALEFVTERRPDIILTDIRMPGMTGLAFIEELKRRGCRSKVLFMSGYKDFEYASEAIRLGAQDYLVKPFNEQRLTSALASVMEVIAQERRQAYERETLLKKSMYHSLTTGYQWELASGSVSGQSEEADSGLVYYVLAIDLSLPSELTPDERSAFEAKLRAWEKRPALAKFGALLVYDDVSRLALVYTDACNGTAGRETEARWNTIRREIEEGLEVVANVGVSSPLGSSAELPRGYEEARKASQRMYFAGEAAIYVHAEGAGEDELPADPFESSKLTEALMLGKQAEARMLLARGFERFRASGQGDREAVVRACRQLLARVQGQAPRRGDAETPEKFETAAELQAWMAVKLEEAAVTAKDAAASPDDLTIAKIKQYCQAHIGEDITLQHVAEFAGYNKAYFSSYFKKKTGASFWDYLTGLRVEKAKEMLEKTTLNAYEIGQAIGYHNPSHFGKMFKQTVGCTPAEYKAAIAGFAQ
ncbi:response regulator [Paenibacillus sacheonensis]|uniref:Response regulator n=1 Tax=Paenibacillus sacheonensis TaxID=742054 RepID=A0A7X5C4A0_9BACL|nr:response regulator [Paenibacillus sacheonensis]MBM7568471.1 two-component system response regulator YesN [Paenibacillus sacheonensis]NBC72169.1 response regulator [Paenibacillus sacheonensis]